MSKEEKIKYAQSRIYIAYLVGNEEEAEEWKKTKKELETK